jgi:hypothetical protein
LGLKSRKVCARMPLLMAAEPKYRPLHQAPRKVHEVVLNGAAFPYPFLT